MIQLIKPMILASASPRRHELLQRSGLPFEVVVSQVDETIQPMPAHLLVQSLARQKAQSVADSLTQDAFVLGADTLVVIDDQILGKPADQADACRMISLLQGRSHDVHTGLCLIDTQTKQPCLHTETTEVTFAPMSDREIEEYVACGESLDKAGAYGIQGACALYISGIRGCYFNVMGLPLHALYRMLTNFCH